MNVKAYRREIRARANRTDNFAPAWREFGRRRALVRFVGVAVLTAGPFLFVPSGARESNFEIWSLILLCSVLTLFFLLVVQQPFTASVLVFVFYFSVLRGHWQWKLTPEMLRFATVLSISLLVLLPFELHFFRFLCPNCGRRYFAHWFKSNTTFANCQHCHLRKGALSAPEN